MLFRSIDVNQSFNYANNFYRAPDGRIYMAAQDGLYYMENGRVDKWQSLSSTFYNLIPNGIAYDKEGKLWIGTYGNGVYVFDRDEKVVALLRSEDGFSSNATSEIFTDSQQRLWIAGHDGLSLIRDTSRPTEYENYSYNSGLSDIHIRSIREDSEGNIWFSTNNGLTCLLKDSGKFENYDYRSGLPQGNFLERAADFDPETGLMYFGSLSGLCYFNPAERPMTGEKIPVRIVECRTINFNDDGNGMTREQLIDGFMRISSSDKIDNPISPLYHRKRAGEKGIGRFAVQRLGAQLIINTKSIDSNCAYEVVINWDEYESNSNLMEISHIIREVQPEFEKGTKLTILNLRDKWSEASIRRIYR